MEVSELNLADGEYTVEVTMEGGSGRASVQSPTELSVENGQAEAKIVWSSSIPSAPSTEISIMTKQYRCFIKLSSASATLVK